MNVVGLGRRLGGLEPSCFGGRHRGRRLARFILLERSSCWARHVGLGGYRAGLETSSCWAFIVVEGWSYLVLVVVVLLLRGLSQLEDHTRWTGPR